MKPVVTRQKSGFRIISHFFGPCFRILRLQAKLTQRAVAEMAGVSRCTVSDFENGKRATIGSDYVEKMVHAVGSTFMMLVSMADRLSQQEA